MTNLFIDTNIFLRFYNFDQKSLDKFMKLADKFKENKLYSEDLKKITSDLHIQLDLTRQVFESAFKSLTVKKT